MKTVYRSLTAILLSLLIIVTSGSLAIARGQPDAAGQIVLCTGYGPQTVSVDQNGQPIAPAHMCPDCALSYFDATHGFSNLVPGFVYLSGQFIGQCYRVFPREHLVFSPQARGPPAKV